MCGCMQLEIFFGNGEVVDAAKAALVKHEGVLLNYRKIWSILERAYRFVASVYVYGHMPRECASTRSRQNFV